MTLSSTWTLSSALSLTTALALLSSLSFSPSWTLSLTWILISTLFLSSTVSFFDASSSCLFPKVGLPLVVMVSSFVASAGFRRFVRLTICSSCWREFCLSICLSRILSAFWHSSRKRRFSWLCSFLISR